MGRKSWNGDQQEYERPDRSRPSEILVNNRIITANDGRRIEPYAMQGKNE